MTHVPEALSSTLPAPELLAIPALPLAACLLLIFFGRRIGRWSGWVTVAALSYACGVTLGIGKTVVGGTRLVASWAWLSATDPGWSVGLAVDGLSWLMLLVVTAISALIAIYSIGYMRDDPREPRFFAYCSLFCAAMLGLAMADHFVLLYGCWELVGLCSYLLISFWFEKPAAAAAGRKAFITTRIGDTGLLLGILLLAWTAGELRFNQLDAIRARLPLETLTLISLLIFLGAAGKSAQIPLHVWLPDAMEGPTPVSALIHAATMVAAGVYLIARTMPLFTPQSLAVVLVIGLLTHLFAGTVALTMTDIKRILAYSTVSQLGLMMAALGLGAASLAMFHLATHACFKALLFLGAGSVIHATHQQELAHLGGLRRAMPWTAAAFLIAALSMSGLFFLSGFWSKDAIILEAQHKAPWVMGLLLIGAVMTAGYVFRLYLRCFEGRAPEHAGHGAHARPGLPRTGAVRGLRPERAGESPNVMVVPMALLAVGAAVVGLAGSPWLGQPLFHLLGVADAHEGLDLPLLVASWCAAGVGIWLAWTVGVTRRTLLPEVWRPLGRRLYTWAAHKYYVDELYDRVVIKPFLAATERLAVFDHRVIDGAVDGAGRLGWWLGVWKERCDRIIVDGLVNRIAGAVQAAGSALRLVQTGVIQQYLLVVVVSVVVLSFLLRR